MKIVIHFFKILHPLLVVVRVRINNRLHLNKLRSSLGLNMPDLNLILIKLLIMEMVVLG